MREVVYEIGPEHFDTAELLRHMIEAFAELYELVRPVKMNSCTVVAACDFVCSLGNGANRLKGPPACEKRQDGADEEGERA